MALKDKKIKRLYETGSSGDITGSVFWISSSVEEEALETFAAVKEAERMERELRNFVKLSHGPNAWNELLKMQIKIRKQRQETLYAQEEARRKVLNILGIIVLCTIVGGVIVWIGYLYYLKRQGEFG